MPFRFISSLPYQVLFHDVTFTMGQVVSREGQGREETLFRCVRSMPSNPARAYNSCYSAGEKHAGRGVDERRAGQVSDLVGLMQGSMIGVGALGGEAVVRFLQEAEERWSCRREGETSDHMERWLCLTEHHFSPLS